MTDMPETETVARTERTASWSGRRAALASGLVLLASLLLGGVTSFAQGFLPDSLRSFANSASGWTILTAIMVSLARVGTRLSAVLGAASFVTLVLGYTAVSELRGFAYSPVHFGLIGLVAGPFVGVAVCWLRRTGWQAALGAGLLAGIGIGECVYGLTVVSATTGWFYWVLVGVLGLAVLAMTLIRRVSRPAIAGAGLAVAVVIAAAFLVTYRAAGLL